MPKIGNIPWNKGKKTGSVMSEEGKKRLADLRRSERFNRICVVCGKDFIGRRAVAKYCSEHKRYWEHKRRKRKEPKYKQDGSSISWKKARNKAIERDKGVCQICNEVIGKSIDVHHIDEKSYAKKKETIPNHSLDNLVCLCHKCHFFISSYLWHKKNNNWEKVLELIKKKSVQQ